MLLAGIGCSQWSRSQDRNAPSHLDVEDIVARCSDVYQDLNTLHMRGYLIDNRKESQRVVPIRWDVVRPDRCRFQIDMDVAMIVGETWWSYNADEGRYHRHHQFTRTPVETAAYLVSKSVPFMVPSLLNRGRATFGPTWEGPVQRWSVEGFSWIAGAPCYALVHKGIGAERGNDLTVWIDQDSMLLRGWRIVTHDARNRPHTVMHCEYDTILLNEDIPYSRFMLEPPEPLVAPATDVPPAQPAKD
jgi:outer membrane lipoprotein-sorting protein